LGSGPFVPSIGSSFTLITATEGVGGEFDQLLLPAGFQWNVAYNSAGVVLSVMGSGLTGDYNGNGTVDAADYVVWRDSMGAIGSSLPADGNGDQVVDQDDYAVWRGNFGKTASAGEAAIANSGQVPEPSTFVMGMLAMAVGAARRPRSRQRLT
jgi:hypothetical protein